MTGVASVKVEMPGLGRLAQVFSLKQFDRTIGNCAVRAKAMLQQVTPARFFHQMVKKWEIQTPGEGYRVIINTYQTSGGSRTYLIADLVESGTKNEGTGYIYPTPPKKKLFIPLTAKAVMAYSTRSKRKLVYGVDYVLASKARGIKPRWFVRGEVPKINDMVVSQLVSFIRSQLAQLGGVR